MKILKQLSHIWKIEENDNYGSGGHEYVVKCKCSHNRIIALYFNKELNYSGYDFLENAKKSFDLIKRIDEYKVDIKNNKLIKDESH